MPADWITTSEAAELSGYHPDHVRRLVRAGVIRGQKWGQQWQVSRNSLLAHLLSMKQLGERRGPKREEEDSSTD